MNVEGLKHRHLERHPKSHFFDEETLEFFGEDIEEMIVLPGIVEMQDCMHEDHSCYVLSSLQRKHPMGARRVYHYFDTRTFEHVIP